jgi:hypothetical protein
MPDNFVVFTLQGVDWSLSRVCFTAAGVFFVLGFALGACVLIRHGKVRKLSESEAASVAMHAGETGSVDRAVARRGYATGAEVKVSISIGDLREAYNSRDWFRFFTLHIAILFIFNSFGLVMFGFFLTDRHPVWLLLELMFPVPVSGIVFFCWWAALYTDLQ